MWIITSSNTYLYSCICIYTYSIVEAGNKYTGGKSRNSKASESFDPKLQLFFLRMWFSPLTFIFCKFPGSLRRGYQYSGQYDGAYTSCCAFIYDFTYAHANKICRFKFAYNSCIDIYTFILSKNSVYSRSIYSRIRFFGGAERCYDKSTYYHVAP